MEEVIIQITQPAQVNIGVTESQEEVNIVVANQGVKGDPGTEIELQKTATYIQWRYVGGSWTNLVAIADITGPAGVDGVDGTNGTNGTDGIDGTDGREVEIQNSGTNIEWRYVGDVSWTVICSLASLKGDKGDDGAKAVSVSFVSNDMVFVLDDSSTVTLTNAKIDLKGDPGTDGTDGTNGTDGDDGATPVSASFVGDDLVFVKDDLTTITITDAKIDLKGEAGTDGIDGTNGTDGKEVQLRVDSGYVQWKYDTDIAWTNLFLITDYVTKAAIESVLTGTITSHSHAEIKDAAETTFVDTNSTANCVEMKGNGATTAIIEKLKNSTNVEVRQIDANGNYFNNGNAVIYYKNDHSVYVGTQCVHAGITTGKWNTASGFESLKSITSGGSNTTFGRVTGSFIGTGQANSLFGNGAGYAITGGQHNSHFGYVSGTSNTGSYNTFYGSYSGYSNLGGSSNVYIGYFGGTYQTTESNQLIIDNQGRTNKAGEVANALIFGIFDATKANQRLTINGALRTFGNRKAYSTKTADYTITAIDDGFWIDCTSTGVDGTLPAISAANDGQEYYFRVINFANVPTIITTGTDLFENGTGTFTFSALNERIIFVADNTPAVKIWRQK